MVKDKKVSGLAKHLYKVFPNIAKGYEAARRVYEKQRNPNLITLTHWGGSFFAGVGMYELLNSRKVNKYNSNRKDYFTK